MLWQSSARQERDKLKSELADIKDDPIYVVAAQVREIMTATDPMPDPAVLAEQLFKEYDAALQAQKAQELLDERLEAEKEKLNAQAYRVAVASAELAIQEWHKSGKAKEYYAQQVALESERTETRYIAAAKRDIDAEIYKGRYYEAAETLIADGYEPESREALKERVARIREMSKPTGILELGNLLPGDVIRIEFAAPGTTDEPIADTWGGLNRSNITRSLEVSVDDPAMGMGIVMSDKRYGSASDPVAEQALWQRNREVNLSAVVHGDTIQETQSLPCIVKGAPLTIEGSGRTETTYADHVWWVRTQDLRLLS